MTGRKTPNYILTAVIDFEVSVSSHGDEEGGGGGGVGWLLN